MLGNRFSGGRFDYGRDCGTRSDDFDRNQRGVIGGNGHHHRKCIISAICAFFRAPAPVARQTIPYHRCASDGAGFPSFPYGEFLPVRLSAVPAAVATDDCTAICDFFTGNASHQSRIHHCPLFGIHKLPAGEFLPADGKTDRHPLRHSQNCAGFCLRCDFTSCLPSIRTDTFDGRHRHTPLRLLQRRAHQSFYPTRQKSTSLSGTVSPSNQSGHSLSFPCFPKKTTASPMRNATILLCHRCFRTPAIKFRY